MVVTNHLLSGMILQVPVPWQPRTFVVVQVVAISDFSSMGTPTFLSFLGVIAPYFIIFHPYLGGGFKHFLFSPLFGEDFQLD